MDADTGQIVAAALTTNDVDDGSQAGPLLDQVAGPVVSFTGDGAYDQDGVYASVAERHPEAEVVVPPRATAVPSTTAESEPTQRDRHLQHMADHGRMAWQRASGYTKRARAEAAIGRWKQVIGDRLRAHTDERRVKVPADLWPEFKARVTACYQAPSRAIARDLARGIRADYATALPSAMACFEDDLEACIAHLRLPVTHRRATRTTDALDKPFSSRRGGGVMARGRPPRYGSSARATSGQERGRGCDPRRAAITVAPRLWRPGTRAASELGALPSAARSRR